MKIPQSFQLFGHTIKVGFDNKLVHNHDTVGMAEYRDAKVRLQNSTSVLPRTQQQIEQTFCHELVHHILNQMNEGELRANEKFVDVFSSLLHQALTTSKPSILR